MLPKTADVRGHSMRIKNKTTRRVWRLVLVFLLMGFGCSKQATHERQFQVITEGKGFDNAFAVTQLPVSFQGMVFERQENYQEFLLHRSRFRLYGMSNVWKSDYQAIMERVNFQDNIVVMVMQEGLINIGSTIENVQIQEIRVVDAALEIRVYLPEPTKPPCEQYHMLAWLVGGQVCQPMAVYTNTFQIVMVPRHFWPRHRAIVSFIDHYGRVVSQVTTDVP